jgi:hypothetical protein
LIPNALAASLLRMAKHTSGQPAAKAHGVHTAYGFSAKKD